MLKRVKPNNLKVLIELELKNFIESAGLKDGDIMPSEKELSDSLGASRTAIRESLRGLESLGFVESVHGVGWRVKRFDFDTLLENLPYSLDADTQSFREILEVRFLLEKGFLMRDLDKLTDEAYGRLDSVLKEMERLIESNASEEELIDINGDFHATLYAISNNQFLQELIRTFATIQRRLNNRRSYATGDRSSFLRLHRNLLEAIRSKDRDRVEKAFEEHYAEAFSWVRQNDA